MDHRPPFEQKEKSVKAKKLKKNKKEPWRFNWKIWGQKQPDQRKERTKGRHT